jgi:glycosyltransferase involved in cell wall biosynthesis
MKIAFYLENSNMEGVDLRYPEKGNPGIGGSEYMTIMVANELRKRYSDFMEVTILAADVGRLPAACRVSSAASFSEAVEKAARDSIDILIFKPYGDFLPERILSLESHPAVKGIAWAHNLLNANEWDVLARSKSIAAVINVGREQLDFYRDHQLFYKSTVIYNCLVPSAFDYKLDSGTRSSRVVYMGSLIEAKGFHILAQVWRNIVAEVPEAELHVIGSGRLYGRDNTLGRWGVADPSFEEKFMPYLLDEKGSLLPSVKFHGIVGSEKKEILASAAVGVVNPSGESESFCISAVEFQAQGVPVVSAREWGLLDTVRHGRTGLLCRNRDELIANIVKLLKDVRVRHKLGETGYAFARSRFEVCRVLPEWYRLLAAVKNGRRVRTMAMKSNVFYRNKLVKEIVRRLKRGVPMFRYLGPIESRRIRSVLRPLRLAVSRGAR